MINSLNITLIRHPVSGNPSPVSAILFSWVCTLTFLLFFSLSGYSQLNYPQKLFRSPVDFRIYLSGTYGEIRPNHFHSGIDIRTGGETGKPVYAAADGYVSRIFVSPWGFGKAIYLDHPGGYTTVYGHLDRFRGEIAAYALRQQYTNESFSMDVTVHAGKIQVRKGDVIGYSGNSGSSGGPHLHFEIRDARNQEPLDPLSFGIPIEDHQSPLIKWVRIYPHGPFSMVNFASNPKSLQASGGGGAFSVTEKDTVMVTGDIIFGIEAYDYQDGSSIRCGIKSIELKVDGVHLFGQNIERYAFADTRYVNAILDYPQNMRNKQRYFRSYVAPGNKLDIFEGVVNHGVVNFSDRNAHKIQYIVRDAHGNTSRITFWVRSHPPPGTDARTVVPEQPENLFAWDRENRFETTYLTFTMPANSLYEDLDFHYSSMPPVNGSFASVHCLQDEETPLHLRCSLTIRAETLPRALEEKAILVKVEKGGKFISQGGSFRNGFVEATIREFGDYTIGVDTIPPKIKPVNIYNNKNVSKQSTIVVTISDDLSGIQNYKGTLN
ncbi:MAG: M23 family metallopeptidase, partial [Bacteroidales bacterium]|nr:M23 family metallopeptidase [Bacteroidales bacterium]